MLGSSQSRRLPHGRGTRLDPAHDAFVGGDQRRHLWADGRRGLERLDAIVALAVAANIVLTGTVLVRRSAAGLMNRALPEALQREIHPYATVFTHVEPIEDPRSFDDTALDRASRVSL